MRDDIIFLPLRKIFIWLALAFLLPLSAHAQTTYTYDFQWYSGASQTWVYDAAPMLVMGVYEDLSTPENDVFFKFYNNINTELGYKSALDFMQIDTGTVAPAMFTNLSFWDSSPDVLFNMTTPGTPLTLIDLAAARTAWEGDYAMGKINDSAPRSDGVNPGEFITYRAILSDGFQFSDVINAMNVGMTTSYVNGPYVDWAAADKAGYRAGAPTGLRFALLVRSIVPNEWHSDGHGLFVTNSQVSVTENTTLQITSLTANSAEVMDTETSALEVVAYDPDNGPELMNYQWSIISGGGEIDDATSATPIYTPADVTGTQTITLRVNVSDGAATVSGQLSLQVSDADSPPPGSEILFEDFSSDDLSAWSIRDEGTRTGPSNWRLRSGELVQLSNIWDGGTSSALPKFGAYFLYDYGMGWLDYRLNFMMHSEDNDTLGIMFRYSDSNNYYRFSWDSQRGQRRLIKNENGVFTLLASDDVPYVQGQNYQVELVAQGNLLKVWIDGLEVFEVSDSAHQQGSIAFYSWFNTGAYFDDLSVEDLSGGAFNAFPRIAGLTATPSNILDTEVSALDVVANDPDSGPEVLTHHWSVVSGGGVFDDSSSATPIYTPIDVVGTQTIILRVEVSDGAATVSGELNLQVSDADAPPPGPEILFEDFSSDDLSAWTVWDDGTRTAPSNWSIRSGELVQLSNIWDGGSSSSLPKFGTNLLYDYGMDWFDYRLNFTMSSEDNDTLGVMFRYGDDNNYYRFSWDSQRSQRRLVKNENGVFTQLAADNVAYVLGQDYRVEILVQGNQLEVWIDGIRIFQVNDNAHQQGSFAFYSWFNVGAYFDDLSVEDRSDF